MNMKKLLIVSILPEENPAAESAMGRIAKKLGCKKRLDAKPYESRCFQ